MLDPWVAINGQRSKLQDASTRVRYWRRPSQQSERAASRAYVPRGIWEGAGLRDRLAAAVASIQYGDVTDLSVFGGAVIDGRSFAKLAGALDRALSADRPVVIDVHTDIDVVAPVPVV